MGDVQPPSLLFGTRQARPFSMRVLRRILFEGDSSVSDDSIGSFTEPWGGHAVGALNRRLADIYGASEAFVTTIGTTFLVKIALYALVGPGDRIIVERDCHVSVVQALTEIGAVPVWVMPSCDPTTGLNLPMDVHRLRQAMDANPDVRVVWITSPKYFGAAADVIDIVKFVHSRGGKIAVDEAHGAHLIFHPDMPTSATEAGADLVTHSWHKTTEAVSQASVLLINDPALRSRVLMVLHGTVSMTTSPLYGIAATVEAALESLVAEGAARLSSAISLANLLRETASVIAGVKVVEFPRGGACAGQDPLRVALDVKHTGLTGFEICARLQARGIVPELATLGQCLFMTTYGNTRADVRRTVHALAEAIGDRNPAAVPAELPVVPQVLGEQVLSPREAFWQGWRGNSSTVPVTGASGLISAETIAVYPPGNALVVHGERLTDEIVTFLRASALAGAHLKGATDPAFETIGVINEGGSE
jgi:arginine decarboxylase